MTSSKQGVIRKTVKGKFDRTCDQSVGGDLVMNQSIEHTEVQPSEIYHWGVSPLSTKKSRPAINEEADERPTVNDGIQQLW